MQTTFELLEQKLAYKWIKFCYLPDINKSQNQKGWFLSQDTSCIRKPFNINSALYTCMMVSSSSLPAKKQNKEPNTSMTTSNSLAKMHIRTGKQKSKTEAMFFPKTLIQAKKQNEVDLPDILLNDNQNMIHFTPTFSYLWVLLNPELTKGTQIEVRINKAFSQLGILEHYFNCHDIDICIKYWVYISGPLNTLFWVVKSWNPTRNKWNFHSFHHSTTRRILGLRHDKSKHNPLKMNKLELSSKTSPLFIPSSWGEYWSTLVKLIKTVMNHSPKKLLAVWIKAPRKEGQPQNWTAA